MKIVSWNVNGIRAVYKKNFLQWLEEESPHIVCLQEIKAEESEFRNLFAQNLFRRLPYHIYVNSARKSGYSGVAILSTTEPLKFSSELGMERFDSEGRILVLEYSEFTLINLYLPHGGRQKENLPYKLEAYDDLLRYLKTFKSRNVILVGDFNVARADIDLARPKENRSNTMFTPAERKQLNNIIELGFVDSFRKFHQEGGHYTWWPYSVVSRNQDLGWRIDYVFVSKNFESKLKNAFILSDVGGSDHCPIGIEI